MAQRIDTITQHIFSFDDDEITAILNALYEAGHDELADEIWDELPGECEGECEYQIEVGDGEFEQRMTEEILESLRAAIKDGK